METITEDYVSFETAKLLKEKGFDSYPLFPCYKEDNGKFIECPTTLDTINYSFIPAPTIQRAMKWLRKVHNLYINIWADPKDVENNNFNTIFRAQVYNGNSNYGTSEYSTYEDAAEAAIKYCLDNLI